MSDLNLVNLREIAGAATPGPWAVEIYKTRRRSPRTRRWLEWKPEDGTHGFVSIVESDGVYGVLDGPDAAHVAAFDPPTVIALIDEIERLRETLAVVKAITDGAPECDKYDDESVITCGWKFDLQRIKEVVK